MRRFFLAFALTLIAAASVTAVAFAKEGGVELSSTPPGGIGPGDPWTPSMTLIDNQGQLPANPAPGIRITNLDTGRTIDYAATPTDDPAVWNVRVVFPTPGQWDYAAYDGVTDRLYEYPATTVLAPKATLTETPRAPATANEGSFPVWPLLGGIGGAVLLGSAAVLVIRNRRFAH
jgi:hypothetical protein